MEADKNLENMIQLMVQERTDEYLSKIWKTARLIMGIMIVLLAYAGINIQKEMQELSGIKTSNEEAKETLKETREMYGDVYFNAGRIKAQSDQIAEIKNDAQTVIKLAKNRFDEQEVELTEIIEKYKKLLVEADGLVVKIKEIRSSGDKTNEDLKELRGIAVKQRIDLEGAIDASLQKLDSLKEQSAYWSVANISPELIFLRSNQTLKTGRLPVPAANGFADPNQHYQFEFTTKRITNRTKVEVDIYLNDVMVSEDECDVEASKFGAKGYQPGSQRIGGTPYNIKFVYAYNGLPDADIIVFQVLPNPSFAEFKEVNIE